jgi:hypothetical protein
LPVEEQVAVMGDGGVGGKRGSLIGWINLGYKDTVV